MNHTETKRAAQEATLLGNVAADFFDRIGRGEKPDIEHYAQQYPEIADVIREMFPALQLLEPSANDQSWENALDIDVHELNRLGDYEILREIGRGGMGVVYEAHQISLNRRVALKILPFAAVADPKHLARFKNEAQAVASLDHPNIVDVYAIGCERSVHYFAMRYIEGQSVAELIGELRQLVGNTGAHVTNDLKPSELARDLSSCPSDKRPTPGDDPTVDAHENPAIVMPSNEETLRELQAAIPTQHPGNDRVHYFRNVAKLGSQAASALDHAHEQGILHRDIKPGNLMVDGSGKLYVTDFGLARIEADAGMTLTGDILGTLRYMAPEQALAKRVVIDHRADVYSLGATLYELVALRPAFGENDRHELLKQIAFVEPTALRKIDRHVPVELETIVLKAMAKSPDERYQSSQELADDLQAYLDERPIKAKPPNFVDCAAKWSRRHVAAVLAALVFSVGLLLTMAVFSAVLARSAKQSRAAEALAIQATETANREKEQALRNLYRGNVQVAYHDWQKGRVDRALTQLNEASPEDADIDYRRWEWYFVNALCSQGAVLEGMVVQAPPACPTRLIERIEEGRTDFVNHATGEVVLSVPGRMDLTRLNRDASLLALCKDDSEQIEVYDLKSRRLLWFRSMGAEVIEWSPNGNSLFAHAGPGASAMLDATTGDTLVEFTENVGGRYAAVALTEDGKRLLMAISRERIGIWNAETGRYEKHLAIPSAGTLDEYGISVIASDPTGERVVVGGRNRLWILSLENSRLEQTISAHRGLVGAAEWSPDGRFIASAGMADAVAKIWDVSNGSQAAEFRGHTGMIHSIEWAADGHTLFSTCDDRGTLLWQRSREIQPFALPCRGPMAWSSDGCLLAVKSQMGAPGCEIYDPAKETVISRFEDEEWRDAYCLGASPDGQRIASGHIDGTLRMWDRRNGKLIYEEKIFPRRIHCMSWHPDGKSLVVSGESSETPFLVIDTQNGEQLAESPSIGGELSYGGVAWSPDGSLIAGFKRRVVRVWRADTWREILRSTTGDGGNGYANAVSWSPKGDQVATSTGEIINIWNVKTGQNTARIRAHIRETYCLAWSPDGGRIASGGDDHLIKVWDVETCRDMLTLEGHVDSIRYLAWSPDGKRLASANNSEVLLWDATAGYAKGITQEAKSME